MRQLADFLSALKQPGQDRAALREDYLAREPAAKALVVGAPPHRLIPTATLRDWIAEETGLPDWLIDDSRAATSDLTEALALLLPPCSGDEPGLAEVLADLTQLPPGPLARPAILSMARRLSPTARVLYFRLITGTFRPPVVPQHQTVPVAMPHEVLAVMTYAEAALPTGARGPEITLALWQDGTLIPVARARPNLPDDQTARLLSWIRQTTTGRFGPLRAVPPVQVFALRFSALTRNWRRKSGVDLTDPQINAWYPDVDPLEAASLAALTALLPATP